MWQQEQERLSTSFQRTPWKYKIGRSVFLLKTTASFGNTNARRIHGYQPLESAVGFVVVSEQLTSISLHDHIKSTHGETDGTHD